MHQHFNIYVIKPEIQTLLLSIVNVQILEFNLHHTFVPHPFVRGAKKEKNASNNITGLLFQSWKLKNTSSNENIFRNYSTIFQIGKRNLKVNSLFKSLSFLWNKNTEMNNLNIFFNKMFIV